MRSLMVNSRWIEKSRLKVVGPERILRPTLPNVPVRAVVKASVVNHLLTRCPSGPLVSDGFEITSARSLPTPLSESSSPEVMVKGNPLCQFKIPVGCHPPITARCKALSLGEG